MDKRMILLFGFTSLPEILAVRSAADACGAELRTVGERDCGLTLGELAAGKSAPAGASPAGVSCRMMVLCGCGAELDGVLASLRRSGTVCLKAVLTPRNRNWTPARLAMELSREHQAIHGKGR